jgi:hypothetical protein
MQDLSLDQTNTTRFLFGDDEEHAGDAKSFLQVNATEENFPILVRHHQVRFPTPKVRMLY